MRYIIILTTLVLIACDEDSVPDITGNASIDFQNIVDHISNQQNNTEIGVVDHISEQQNNTEIGVVNYISEQQNNTEIGIVDIEVPTSNIEEIIPVVDASEPSEEPIETPRPKRLSVPQPVVTDIIWHTIHADGLVTIKEDNEEVDTFLVSSQQTIQLNTSKQTSFIVEKQGYETTEVVANGNSTTVEMEELRGDIFEYTWRGNSTSESESQSHVPEITIEEVSQPSVLGSGVSRLQKIGIVLSNEKSNLDFQ